MNFGRLQFLRVGQPTTDDGSASSAAEEEEEAERGKGPATKGAKAESSARPPRVVSSRASASSSESSSSTSSPSSSSSDSSSESDSDESSMHVDPKRLAKQRKHVKHHNATKSKSLKKAVSSTDEVNCYNTRT